VNRLLKVSIAVVFFAALVSGCADVRGKPEPECTYCHGSDGQAAPPVDTRGHVDKTMRGVGAHQAHLAPKRARPVPCETCHVVPETAKGHQDGPPAEVVFSGLAVAALGAAVDQGGGAFRDDTHVTCRNIYCHGATLSGGTLTEPIWNASDSAKFGACGACHGMPPDKGQFPHQVGPHKSITCGKCHPDAKGSSDIAQPGDHVNGKVDADPAARDCSMCHQPGGESGK